MSRERMLQVLRGSSSARVSFSISSGGRTITVNGSTFQRVAQAIENGTISLTILPQSQIPLNGAGAVYYSVAGVSNNPSYVSIYGPNIAANSLFSQDSFGRVEEGMLIHESVHASLDLTRSSGNLTVFEEAACYVAEVLHNRRHGLSRSRINETIRVATLPVVNSIIETGNANPAAVTNLINTITTHPLYAPNAGVCYARNG